MLEDKKKTSQNEELNEKSAGAVSRFRQVLTGVQGTAPRLITGLVVVLVIGLAVVGMRVFSQNTNQREISRAAAGAEKTEVVEEESNPTQAVLELSMPIFDVDTSLHQAGVQRVAELHTTIPTRSRVDVITYTVEQGDSLFAIADNFGLKPETVLWGNFDTLADNPHTLSPGQELNILPVNGTYHKWREGESLTKVSEYYGVDPMDIIEYPGNKVDIYNFDLDNPAFEPGEMLIVPGGKRELVDYGPPTITRNNPAAAATYGPGHCGTIYTGAVGVGVFIWPTTERWISGYDYNPGAGHPAIDIAGSVGNPVWASDNGVVVYAGWSDYGYGNLVVIDHGNGWQTLYAHLNSINVGCGQSVNQGQGIGGLGSTGNSTGAHLHLEMIYNGSKVNPWNFLQ